MNDNIDRDLQAMFRRREAQFDEQPFVRDAIRQIRESDAQFRLLKFAIAALSLLALALMTSILTGPVIWGLRMLNHGLTEGFTALSQPWNLLALLVTVLIAQGILAFVRTWFGSPS